MTTKSYPSFSTAARWIWGGDVASEPSPKNDWRYFRTTVDVPAEIARATLLITADSAYELHVNGAFTGRGPVRSFPFAYAYDVYDVTPLVQQGAEHACRAGSALGRPHDDVYPRGGGAPCRTDCGDDLRQDNFFRF